MVLPGTTIEVLKSLQKRGLSVQQIAKHIGTSAKSIYEALNGNTSGEVGVLVVQLYIKFKLDDAKKSNREKQSEKKAFVHYRIREKKVSKKNELIKGINNLFVSLDGKFIGMRNKLTH